jgi:hypothetical protein
LVQVWPSLQLITVHIHDLHTDAVKQIVLSTDIESRRPNAVYTSEQNTKVLTENKKSKLPENHTGPSR